MTILIVLALITTEVVTIFGMLIPSTLVVTASMTALTGIIILFTALFWLR